MTPPEEGLDLDPVAEIVHGLGGVSVTTQASAQRAPAQLLPEHAEQRTGRKMPVGWQERKTHKCRRCIHNHSSARTREA